MNGLHAKRFLKGATGANAHAGTSPIRTQSFHEQAVVSETHMNTISLVVLAALLAAATWTDIRSNRIPNALVLTGTIVGIAFSLASGGIGLKEMALGFATGFALLLPFYALGIMGAGDVKLLAMAGAFLGINAIALAGVATLAVGGILAIGYALKSGVLFQVLRNIRTFIGSAALHLASGSAPHIDDMPVSRGRLPYAAAVSAGVLASQLAVYRL
jgi:prepilin peptidase CpaA